MKTLRACFAVMALGVLVSARAATVQLNDGRVYEADVLAEDKNALLLGINGMRVQIPRTMIASVDAAAREDAQAPLKDGEIRLLSPGGSTAIMVGGASRPPQRVVVSEQKGERESIAVSREAPNCPKLEAKLPLPEDPVKLDQLRDAVNGLQAAGNGDSLNLITASGPEGLGALVRFGLYHQSPIVRARSVQLLSQLGGQSALKALVETFYSAAHPTIPPYQVQFVENLTDQITRLTGHNFHFYVRSGARAPMVAQNMVQWWRQNYAALPPQLGEPELDPKDECYATELADLRALTLERREFAGTSLPADISPKALPGTPTQEGYLTTVPRIPDNLQLERNVPHGGEAFAPKPIERGADIDSPGYQRRLEYTRRMREYIDVYGRR
jgi:hypothetical protein